MRPTTFACPAAGYFPSRTPSSQGLVPYVQKSREDSLANNALLMFGTNTLHQQRDDGNNHMHILNGAWDMGDVGSLGTVTLKSISAYRTWAYQADQDLDGSPYHVAEGSQLNHFQTWSQELQWVGAAPRVHYVVGGYYYGEYAMQHESQNFFGALNNLPYKNFNRVKSYAGYGQITYTPPILSDKLSLTAGMRFSKEQVHLTHIWGKDAGSYSTSPGFTGDRGSAFGGFNGKGAPGISPMADISYQATDELMLYGRVSRGFTGGGFNPTASLPELFNSFEPERLLQYEMGFKSQWLDNHLRVNADGYFSQYSDLQQSVFRATPTLGALSIPSNVDKAEIWGMEFEGLAIPFEGVEVSGNYAFIAPKFTEWNDQVFDANGNPIFDQNGKPVTENVAHDRTFNFSPRNQISVGLTYTAPPTTTGVFSAHADWYWQDKVVFIANNDTPGAQADEGWAYYLVNGRLAYTGIPLQKGTLDVAVFARNIFDRKYRTYGIDFGPVFGLATNNYGNPRTFGLQVVYNFTAE
ncbi:MAG: TonB-dependent receptor [Candidatus Binatia bacterium]